jgi:HrpA-like RNA helicase
MKINLYDMDLLDLPSADTLHAATEILYVLGAINSNSIPTPVGFVMNKIRMLSPESVRMILAGYAWDAPVIDLITIAAFLESKPDDLFPRGLAEKYESARVQGLFTLFRNGGKIPEYGETKSLLFMADDFIKFAIVFVEFQKIVFDITKGTDRAAHMDDARAWCEERGMSYNKIVEIASFRDGIINNLAAIGLDAFAGHKKGLRHLIGTYSDDDKMNYIRMIKQCIFEGYKLNIAVWDAKQGVYKARKSNIPLTIVKGGTSHILTASDRELFGDTNPKFIMYSKCLVRKDGRTNMYNAEVSAISVLDGYIPYDQNYDTLA